MAKNIVFDSEARDAIRAGVHKLANAVNELLSDKQKAKRLANNGNKFVKNNMTWDIILPKYIQFYEDLLAIS